MQRCSPIGLIRQTSTPKAVSAWVKTDVGHGPDMGEIWSDGVARWGSGESCSWEVARVEARRVHQGFIHEGNPFSAMMYLRYRYLILFESQKYCFQ